jgi:hypothetical protein
MSSLRDALPGLLVIGLLLTAFTACGGDETRRAPGNTGGRDGGDSGTGGRVGSGGSTSTGGNVATGGKASGGAVGSGGAAAGGTVGAGGSSTGGRLIDAGPDGSAGKSATDAGGDGPSAEGGPFVPDGGSCASGNLLVNGSFETPVLASGGYRAFSVGQTFDGWTVVGSPGSLGPLSGAFTDGARRWQALCGAQAVDLTGLDSNAATGISQAVTTTPGREYFLQVWVGNVRDTVGSYGLTSSVRVSVNGVDLATFTNDGDSGNDLSWKRFGVRFRASSASTIIALFNADPAGDNSNIIDDVFLE